MFDVSAVRRRFATTAQKAYLSSGSYGLLSTEVEQAMQTYLSDWQEKGADWEGWMDRYERVRQSVARLLGSTIDEIALTASVSAGINAVASALDFSNGRDKIVLSNFEFPTSAQIWHTQALRGARIEHVTEEQGNHIPLEHFEAAIDERTKIVSISRVCYRNGAKLDIDKISEIARRKGALVIVDGYQSIGTEPLDVSRFDVDFVVGGTMKYLVGGAGLGFLYVRGDLIPQLTPTVSGWYAQQDFFAMDIFANTPSSTARRFEAGTPSVPSLYAAEAGLGIIHELGTAEIWNHIRDLSRRCIDRLGATGWAVATPNDDAQRGPMVAIRAKDDALLVKHLAERGVVTSCRDGNVRAAFHFYNNDDDVDRLMSVLDRHADLRA